MGQMRDGRNILTTFSHKTKVNFKFLSLFLNDLILFFSASKINFKLLEAARQWREKQAAAVEAAEPLEA